MNDDRPENWLLETKETRTPAKNDMPAGQAPAGGAADMNSSLFRLALIDPRTLVRTAMCHFLKTWIENDGMDYFRISPFASRDEFLNRCRDPAHDIDVVAMNIGAASMRNGSVRDEINQLRSRVPELPVVIMSDEVEPWSELEALRQGIRGYIPTTLSPSIAIRAIRLVQAGGTFLPSGIIPNKKEHKETTLKPRFGASPRDLTARQQEVLDLIRLGKPNKLIAAELKISQSTVKVYVRQIMKKLGAINRTHACYLLSRFSWNGETERRRHAR